MRRFEIRRPDGHVLASGVEHGDGSASISVDGGPEVCWPQGVAEATKRLSGEIVWLDA